MQNTSLNLADLGSRYISCLLHISYTPERIFINLCSNVEFSDLVVLGFKGLLRQYSSLCWVVSQRGEKEDG